LTIYKNYLLQIRSKFAMCLLIQFTYFHKLKKKNGKNNFTYITLDMKIVNPVPINGFASLASNKMLISFVSHSKLSCKNRCKRQT